MPYVLLCRGNALDGVTDDGKYLRAFDVDAGDGVGSVEWGTLDEAKRFPTRFEATKTVMTVSKVQRKRDDGKPNRPLTAWSWEVERVDQ